MKLNINLGHERMKDPPTLSQNMWTALLSAKNHFCTVLKLKMYIKFFEVFVESKKSH